MKRTRSHRSSPTWRQREHRHLVWAVTVGGLAAAIVAVLIFVASHRGAF